MKKRTASVGSLAAGALLLAAHPVVAQLVYEPFDYGSAANTTNLANLSGSPTFAGYVNPMSGTGWFDTNTGTAVAEEATLSSSALPVPSGFYPAVGGSALYGNTAGTAHTARLTIAPVGFTSGTIYYSLSLKITDITNLSAGGVNGVFIGGFNNTPGTQTGNPGVVGARLQLRTDSVNTGSFNVGVRGNFATAGIVYDSTAYAAGASGDTVFIVGAYTLGPAAGDDVSSIWINPSSSTYGAATAPATAITITGGSDPAGGIASFLLRQGNTSVPKGIQVDELRIDTSWAQVTPPADHVWSGSAGTNWSDTGNWTGSVPNAAAAFASFRSGPGGSVVVDSPQTVGSMIIQNTNSYTISGTSAITMDGGAGGASNINVLPVMNSTGPAVILPSTHTISAPITLNGNLSADVGGGQTLILASNISGGAVSLAKNGAGTLELSGSNSYTGDTVINNGTLLVAASNSLGSSSGNLVFNGANLRAAGSFVSTRNLVFNTYTVGAITVGGGTIDTAGFNPSILGAMSGTGTLTKLGAGALTVQHARIPTLTVSAGAVHVANSGANNAPGSVSNVKTLNVAGATDAWTAKADLDNNAAVVDYTGTTMIDTIQNQLKSGYSGGAWGGNGIDSTAAVAAASTTTKTAVGYVEATSLFSTFPASFLGQTVDNTSILMQYVLSGDTDFSGTVDTVDFNRLAASFSQSGKHWIEGDFDYSGTVDTVDFNLLAGNFSKVLSGGPSVGTLVPEPASISPMTLAAAAIATRRRRR